MGCLVALLATLAVLILCPLFLGPLGIWVMVAMLGILGFIALGSIGATVLEDDTAE